MKRNLYFALCAPASAGGGILHCVLDGTELVPVRLYPCDRPMYLTVSEDRMFVLLRAPFADSRESGMCSCRISEDGTLSEPDAVQSTRGEVACHLCVLDGNVYAVNYSSGSVIRFPNLVAAHHGHSVHPTRQEGPHTHCIVPTPDGQYLAVCDLGLDKIILYDRGLQPVSEVSTPAGSGPRHLVFSDDGREAFCACELSSSLCVFSYHAGTLEFLYEVPCLPADHRGESYPAAIRYLEGRVYVSNRGHDSVTVFERAGERFSPVRRIPTQGSYPRDFDIFGSVLVAANERSGSVSITSLSDGIPQSSSLFEGLPTPLCVIKG